MWKKKKKNCRGSVRKGVEGSRINDFIRNIKMRKITVRGGRGDKCVCERESTVCAEVMGIFLSFYLMLSAY